MGTLECIHMSRGLAAGMGTCASQPRSIRPGNPTGTFELPVISKQPFWSVVKLCVKL